MRIQARYEFDYNDSRRFLDKEQLDKMIKEQLQGMIINEAIDKNILEVEKTGSNNVKHECYSMSCFVYSELQIKDVFRILGSLKNSNFVSEYGRHIIKEILEILRH